MVILKISECPANLDDIAESYIMGILPEEQASAFEDHYAVCNDCATALLKAPEYVDAMSAAKQSFQPLHLTANASAN